LGAVFAIGNPDFDVLSPGCVLRCDTFSVLPSRRSRLSFKVELGAVATVSFVSFMKHPKVLVKLVAVSALLDPQEPCP